MGSAMGVCKEVPLAVADAGAPGSSYNPTSMPALDMFDGVGAGEARTLHKTHKHTQKDTHTHATAIQTPNFIQHTSKQILTLYHPRAHSQCVTHTHKHTHTNTHTHTTHTHAQTHIHRQSTHIHTHTQTKHTHTRAQGGSACGPQATGATR